MIVATRSIEERETLRAERFTELRALVCDALMKEARKAKFHLVRQTG